MVYMSGPLQPGQGPQPSSTQSSWATNFRVCTVAYVFLMHMFKGQKCTCGVKLLKLSLWSYFVEGTIRYSTENIDIFCPWKYCAVSKWMIGIIITFRSLITCSLRLLVSILLVRYFNAYNFLVDLCWTSRTFQKRPVNERANVLEWNLYENKQYFWKHTWPSVCISVSWSE